MSRLSKKQQELLDWLRDGHTVELGDRNRVYRHTGGWWMRNTLTSLVERGLAEPTAKDSRYYRVTTVEAGKKCPLCYIGHIRRRERYYYCSYCQFEYELPERPPKEGT